ncbi:MAG: type II secretion system F family protein [Erysipelothrix sp.]|nr:type II secretion system F family protein [Erysipelothrix sp.]
MKNFTVTTMDRQGKTNREFMTVENVEDLKRNVREKNLYLVDFKETDVREGTAGRLKVKNLVIFSRQLGTMINSGIPIIQALDLLQNKANDKKSKTVFRQIYEDVQKGNSLSDAMHLQRGVFPELLTNMVAAGEVGGTLDESLNRMATHYEKEQKLASKIRSASIYPAILAVVSVFVVLVLVMFVLPTITGMFEDADIPWTTQIIMNFSHFLIDNWLVLLIVLIVLVVAVRLLIKVRSIRIEVDRLKLRLPVFGKLNRTVYSARCARAFSSLYSSGVQTLDMIETTGKVLNNAYLEELFVDVLAEVSRGELISRAIENTQEFDPMFGSMLYIGEEAGSLGDILSTTADYFDDEADAAIQRMIAMIEPVMIVVLGLIIGFIVVAIIQPIFQMYETLG